MNIENNMKNFVGNILPEILTQLDRKADRASIFLPDTPEYLSIWSNHGLPAITITRTRCYIGPDPHIRRGIAGMAFFTKKLRIGHILGEPGDWRCDDNDFIKFTDRIPQYRSLISIPLIEEISPVFGSHTMKCLGVLSLDSKDETFFDIEDTKNFLLTVGERIASLLSLYQTLSTTSL